MMKKGIIAATMVVGLMMMATVASAAYCTNIQSDCLTGEHRQVCCNEPPSDPTMAPPPFDPNNPSGGITICGEIDDLVGGCAQLPPGTIAGCIDGAGLDLASPPPIDPNNPPAFPPNNCGNLAAT